MLSDACLTFNKYDSKEEISADNTKPPFNENIYTNIHVYPQRSQNNSHLQNLNISAKSCRKFGCHRMCRACKRTHPQSERKHSNLMCYINITEFDRFFKCFGGKSKIFG